MYEAETVGKWVSDCHIPGIHSLSPSLSKHTNVNTQQEVDQECNRQEACKDRQKQAYFDVRSKEVKFKTEVEELEVRRRAEWMRRKREGME